MRGRGLSLLLSSHLVHAVFLNTIFPTKPFRCIFLGGVLLNLCHIVVPQSCLESRNRNQKCAIKYEELISIFISVKKKKL